MKSIAPLLLLLCLFPMLPAQEFSAPRLKIDGYTRADGFVGLNNQTDPLLQSLYGETDLRLQASTGQWGRAFTDLRFRTGTEYGSEFTDLDIREAYLDLYLGKLDFRIGKQITPWGRADGWNPTDNLTPSNFFVRSPNPDDIRMGSWRIRGQVRPWDWLKVEADLVPWYTPSVYRFDLIEMPSFVTIYPTIQPGFQWEKTTAAAKLDLTFPAIDGSVSWFEGYDPLPALKPGTLPQPPFTDFRVGLMPVPYRQRTLGADFATIILNTGLRGEVAWKKPIQGDTIDPFIPNPEVQWVLSLDRQFGSFRIIAAWNGKYVDNFLPADPPQAFDPSILANPDYWPMIGSMLTGQLGYYNRILFDQTHEWSHSILIRPSVTLFHESLDAEVAALCNLTTGEYLIYPKITGNITDGLQVTAGYQYYRGGENTRFKWIEYIFTGPFFELKLTF
jgi:hypothetical protein